MPFTNDSSPSDTFSNGSTTRSNRPTTLDTENLPLHFRMMRIYGIRRFLRQTCW